MSKTKSMSTRKYTPSKKAPAQRDVGATAEKAKAQGKNDGDEIQTFGRRTSSGPCFMFLHPAGCRAGAGCGLRHIVGPMSSAKVVCRDFLHDKCKLGKQCLLDHVGQPTPVFARDQLCGEFNRYGYCSYESRTGYTCKFRHEREKVDKICIQFDHCGTCRWGDTCKFRHERVPVNKICPDFLRGDCQWGDLCKYQHVIEKSRELCKEFRYTGHCSRGELCKFRHERAMKACAPCGQYLSGNCPRGAECKYEHIDKTSICRAYNQGRKCRQGERCSMAHIRLKNGRIERFEKTAGFLSVQKPMVRYKSSTIQSSTPGTTIPRGSRTPSAMSIKTKRSTHTPPLVSPTQVSSMAQILCELREAAPKPKPKPKRVANETARKAKAERIAEAAERQRLMSAITAARFRLQNAQFRASEASGQLARAQDVAELGNQLQSLLRQTVEAEQTAQSAENKLAKNTY